MLSQMTRRVLATTERELLEIENEIFQLQHSITTTQEVISLNLARSRNRLQTLELFASVAALSFGVGAFGAGILGMNLEDGKNPVFQLEGLFWPTTGALTASCGVVMVGCWIAFRRSANLAGLRAGKGDNVAAFTASLAGHDLSYAFVSHRTYSRHRTFDLCACELIRGCATGAALCREAEAAAGSRRRESRGREGQGRRSICRARGRGRRGDRAASRRGRQRGCGRLFAERHEAEEAAEAPDGVKGRVCDDHRVGDGRGAAIGACGHGLQPGGRGRAPQPIPGRLGDSFRSGSFLTACCCAFAELGAGELQGGRGLLRHRREPQRLGVDWYNVMQ